MFRPGVDRARAARAARAGNAKVSVWVSVSRSVVGVTGFARFR